MKKAKMSLALILSVFLLTACSSGTTTTEDITLKPKESESEQTTVKTEKTSEPNDTQETSAINTTSVSETSAEITTIVPETSNETTTAEIKEETAPESNADTAEEINITMNNPSEELYPIKLAVSLHVLREDEDKTIEINVHAPAYVEGAAAGGWFYPIDYSGTAYECACFCDFIADKNKNVTVWDKFDEQMDDIMLKLNEFEYVGTTGEANLGTGRFDEADIYRYGENLILIFNSSVYKKEDFLLYSHDIRKEFFGISNEESSRIGFDSVKLQEALSKRDLEYDPSVFLSAVLYEKSERIDPALP